MKNLTFAILFFYSISMMGHSNIDYSEMNDIHAVQLTLRNIIKMADLSPEDFHSALIKAGYKDISKKEAVYIFESGSLSQNNYHKVIKNKTCHKINLRAAGTAYRRNLETGVHRFSPYNLLIDSLRPFFHKELPDGGMAFKVPHGFFNYKILITDQGNLVDAMSMLEVEEYKESGSTPESFILSVTRLPGKNLDRNTYQIGSAKSPDRNLKIALSLYQGALYYEASYRDRMILNKSELGLGFNDAHFFNGFKLVKKKVSTQNEVWRPIYGKTAEIKDHYNQLTLELADVNDEKIKMMVHFRVYDDGIGFSYEVPSLPDKTKALIVGERTAFHFAGDFNIWAVAEEIDFHIPGPNPVSELTHVRPPVTAEVENHCWISLNEASLEGYTDHLLIQTTESLVKRISVEETPVDLPFKSPWRFIQIAENAAELVESNLMLNLSEPSKIDDPSWIEAGKSMWDWRCIGAKVNGFEYKVNEESYKSFIDFASENGVKYVLFDARWRTEVREEMPGIIDYANNKDVGILLYFDRKGVGRDMDLEAELKLYNKWGAKGIKYGFLVHEPEVRSKNRYYFVQRTFEIARLCAKYEMLLDYHDFPVHPSGEDRTWPNLMAREYCWAQQDNRASFGPETAVTVPFVNNLSGGLDITNGFYDLDELQNRFAVDRNGMNSTVVSETARILVMWAPIMYLPDHPEAYNAKADLFKFLKNMPDTWDETRGLAGYPGEYISVARRSGEAWFVGTVNNKKSREMEIALDFLKEGDYEVTVYSDAPETHYIKNKEAYQISTQRVKKGEKLKVKMAAGGGNCMWIRPL